MIRPSRRVTIRPGSTVECPITIARAFICSRMPGRIGASSSSFWSASPRYQSGPVSLAAISEAACSGGGNAASSLATAALIPSHPRAAVSGLMPPCRNRTPLILRDGRPLSHPARVLTLRSERLTQLDHPERDFLQELLAIGGGIVLAAFGFRTLRRLLVQRRQHLLTKLR